MLTPKLMGACSPWCHHDEDRPSPTSNPFVLRSPSGLPPSGGGVSHPRGSPQPAVGPCTGCRWREETRQRRGGGKRGSRSRGSIVGTACARGWGGSGATHRCHPTALSPRPACSVSQSDTHPRIGMVQRDGGRRVPWIWGRGVPPCGHPAVARRPSSDIFILAPLSVWAAHPGSPTWGLFSTPHPPPPPPWHPLYGSPRSGRGVWAGRGTQIGAEM